MLVQLSSVRHAIWDSGSGVKVNSGTFFGQDHPPVFFPMADGKDDCSCPVRTHEPESIGPCSGRTVKRPGSPSSPETYKQIAAKIVDDRQRVIGTIKELN
jgi:hypothetical protein